MSTCCVAGVRDAPFIHTTTLFSFPLLLASSLGFRASSSPRRRLSAFILVCKRVMSEARGLAPSCATQTLQGPQMPQPKHATPKFGQDFKLCFGSFAWGQFGRCWGALTKHFRTKHFRNHFFFLIMADVTSLQNRQSNLSFTPAELGRWVFSCWPLPSSCWPLPLPWWPWTTRWRPGRPWVPLSLADVPRSSSTGLRGHGRWDHDSVGDA